jgi:hypothetical protein
MKQYLTSIYTSLHIILYCIIFYYNNICWKQNSFLPDELQVHLTVFRLNFKQAQTRSIIAVYGNIDYFLFSDFLLGRKNAYLW